MTRIEFENTTKEMTITNVANLQNDISIWHYGYEITSKDKPIVNASQSPSIRVLFIIKGKLTFTLDKKEHHLGKNDIFVFYPNQNSHLQTSNSNPACYYWVSFQGYLAKDYLARANLPESAPFTHVTNANQLQNAFFQNFNISEANELTTDVIFLENFFSIIKLLIFNRGLTKEKEVSTDYVYMAINYINQNYSNPKLTITEVASNIGVHKNYLSKLFKKNTDITFSQHLTQKRIQVAAFLMDKGLDSVSEIAYKVGFDSPFYFSRVFKTFNSISPQEHIQKLHQQSSPAQPSITQKPTPPQPSHTQKTVAPVK